MALKGHGKGASTTSVEVEAAILTLINWAGRATVQAKAIQMNEPSKSISALVALGTTAQHRERAYSEPVICSRTNF